MVRLSKGVEIANSGVIVVVVVDWVTQAAKALDNLRTAWLNPPEWTREDILKFSGSVGGPWMQYVCDVAGTSFTCANARRELIVSCGCVGPVRRGSLRMGCNDMWKPDKTPDYSGA